ncbi:MAG TPA: alkaline phosphatase family protein [Chloroflexota bacterium]
MPPGRPGGLHGTIPGSNPNNYGVDHSLATALKTRTPIKHLVVIFQENVSFDHYFATYPNAANPAGEPSFTPAPNTPQVNNLATAGLLTNNPNSAQPFRLDRSQSLTCDQNHDYTAEQNAFDGGKMDRFVESTTGSASNSLQYCPKGIVMGYYDGNTVTALWNYAQYFAMNDNSFGTVFGPSTPGVLNLVAGDTGGALCGNSAVYKAPAVCSPSTTPALGSTTGTVVGDPDQYYDKCSSGGFGSKNTAAMAGPNVGDLLNSANVTWGWFNGGFTNCSASHPTIAYDNMRGVDPSTDTATQTGDYSAHHEGFQYYASTSNPNHLAPSSTALIGQTDQANHQYDLSSFWTAADAGNLPAVSFLKAPKYQDGHAGYSDPLDEQQFLVDTINHLMMLPSWSSTAIIISYDDSDGWYDHVPGPIVNRSNTSLDVGCGGTSDGAPARCGYGPRLPYIVISPYARTNYVDHTLIDQSSTLRFIEDNWLGFQRINVESFDNKAGSIQAMFDWTRKSPQNRRLLLNPVTGQRQ